MRPMIYVLITICGTVAGQLMLKRGMMEVGGIPSNVSQYFSFFIRALTNLKVIFSLFLAFIAALGWMAAVSKLELSYVYPFMASTFPLVLFFSWLLFKENVSLLRWIGVFIIWFGVFLVSRS
ncbi:MAG: hypothetical protein DRP08_01275 [Candidatus Aenigmatarchaeota archaeon]|nr:MAG: hypothetical protein DRP08_01275 [Candidatus Aenigmarchaeota archaeon]